MLVLGLFGLLLRLTLVTDYMVHAVVKDPEREAPPGNVIVAPADGTVLYVRRVTDNTIIPEVIKRGVGKPDTVTEKQSRCDVDTEFKCAYALLVVEIATRSQQCQCAFFGR